MAPRRYVPYEGRYLEASAARQHGQLSAGSAHSRRLPLPGLLDNVYTHQPAELDELRFRNNHLARNVDYWRHVFVSTQHEIKELKEHIRNIRVEGDRKTKDLLNRIAKMKKDIRAGERSKKELEDAHIEEQSLLAERRVLASKIQQASQELEKAQTDIKRLPELRAELDGLREKHQRKQKKFLDMECSIIKEVSHMQIMDKNLAVMDKEIARLRTLLNVVRQPNGVKEDPDACLVAAGVKEDPDAYLV